MGKTQDRPAHRAPWSGLTGDPSVADLAVFGVPYDGGASFRLGAAEAPQRIRSLTPHVAPYTEQGGALSGLAVVDLGDVEPHPDWETMDARIAAIARRAQAFPFSIALGGDHSITLPIARSHAQTLTGPIGYLQFDAHLDLMDRFEGSRFSHACTGRRVLELPGFSPDYSAFIGIRSWLGDERAFLAEHPSIHIEPARVITDEGADAVLSRVLPRFRGLPAVYVSLDIDALDPAYAPGTGTPEAAGVSTRDLLRLLEAVFRMLPVRAFDLVEVSPPLDPSDMTSFAAIKILYEIFGWVKERTQEHP